MRAKRFVSAYLALMIASAFVIPGRAYASETMIMPYGSTGDNDPVLWYDFEDGAKDVSGNGMDGVVYGASIDGSSAIFDGKDDYIKMPDGVLKDADAATVAIYLKTEIEKQNQFTWCIGNTSTTGYMFLNTYNPNSKLRAAITRGTYTDESELASDNFVKANEWTSIIAVFDGANSALYRDGALVAENNISIKPSDLGATAANYIAKSVYSDPYFKGTVSDFRIYDRALTAGEVEKLSEEQKSSYTKTAPHITGASGEGIKSHGVEIDAANRTVLLPLEVGTDAAALVPEFTFEAEATAKLTSGTYADGVLTVTDKENPELTADWKITAEERGNAVIDGFYADPNIAVFDGKYYIYPTTDGGSGWDAPYFKCFSSDDLVHWKDEGIILDLKDVSWSNGKNGWAPTIAEKNGKYYFYYSAAPSDNGAKNLAVAVADSPTGPFTDKGVIVKGGSLSGQMIDSAVFTDDDGQSYLYWGNGSMYGAKLSDDMLSIDGEIKKLNPSNFREGSFMIKRNGVYYMMWSDDDTGSPNYNVRYGIMDSPLGTIKGNTQILHRNNAQSDIIKGTGHHSVINIPGTDDWYICYHRFNTALYGNQETQSSAAGNHREVCVDKLEFDGEGNIKPVIPTLRGITEPVRVIPRQLEITKAEADGNILSWGVSTACIGDIYTALYDEAGRLVYVEKNKLSGEFEIIPGAKYILKAFAWETDTQNPLSIAATFVMPADAADGITTLDGLKSAFTTGGSYTLEGDFNVTNSGIVKDVTIDGGSHTLTSTQTGNDSTIYQNENVNSVFKNLTINGNAKTDVGIWEGAGSMTITDATVKNYSVTSSGRRSAVSSGSSGSGKQGNLTLNNVKFINNSDFDITVADAATVTINAGTELNKLRLQSNTCKLNIGEGWSGNFEITMDSPANVELGTIGAGADISGITVSGAAGFSVKNDSGKLVIVNENGAELHFDMGAKETLYHGSTGFLYGAAEINVPSIDLLYGLKPDTMVQKAYGGLQHPTGDAVRTKSALEAAGVRDMQVYLQDIYLEWPYNAPMKNGSLDVDGYTKTCEEILYAMICDKADTGDKGAFLGSDGNYYKLNETEAKKYSYVLFNEPDNIWYGGNLAGLEAAWKQVYEAVHKIDPNARCAGPNFAGFNAGTYDSFLSYCYSNNCLPELITWHELGDSSLTSFFNNYNSVKNSAAKYYTAAYAEKTGRSYQPGLLVNEYARHYDIATSGGLVKWLAMFEDKDMSGCMAYWGMANSLNEVAADQNSPSSTWWVYHWYAQMTGEQCRLTAPAFAATRFYGVTSYDGSINTAYALFGGSEDKHGKETVYLDNMDKTSLANENGAVNVKVYAVGFSGQQGENCKPEVIFDGAVNVTDNTLKIQVTDTDEMKAYFAVISPAPNPSQTTDMENVRLSIDSYEAEDARLIGGAKAYAKTGWSTWAASGRKEVGSINNNGDGVEFTIDVPENGDYDLSLFYSLQAPYVNPRTLEPDANGQNRAQGKMLPFGMQIDGGKAETIYLESTVTWSYRRHYDMIKTLTAGEHTITFTQINGDEGSKGNLQLVAAVDKLDVKKHDDNYGNFEIDLTEMAAFKDGDKYVVTAVAPKSGYYAVSGGDFTISRRLIDYAPDAESYSTISTYDVPVSGTFYLSKGANTLVIEGNAATVEFTYVPDSSEAAIAAKDTAIHGPNAYYGENDYAGYVIRNLGVGADADDTAEDNYIEFNVNVKSDGMYNFEIRYSNDEPAPVMLKDNGDTYVHPYNIDLVERYAQIKINDSEPETVYFRNTFSWDAFRDVNVPLKLKAGDNTVRIYNDNSYHFSPIVNSTAPEISGITVKSLNMSEDGITITSDNAAVDTTALDKTIAEANELIGRSEEYSSDTVATLKSALEGVSRETQSDANKSRKNILDAIDGLKPAPLNLADYYKTSYASSSIGTPKNSYDKNPSTAWTTARSASPYVAYEVFYAGDGKKFDLNEITMTGNGSTRVVYLGTDSDDILKTPAEMGSSSDLAKSGNDLYVPFSKLYSANILGTATGSNATTALTGQYRYFIVAAATWEETSINELELFARIADGTKNQ